MRGVLRTGILWMVFCLFLISEQLYADPTGKITGIIRDAKTRERLPGVEVQILSTTRTTNSTINGRYTFVNVPAGIYTLTASFPGYVDIIKTDVKVQIDRITIVDFFSTKKVKDIERIVFAAKPRILHESDGNSKQVFSPDDITETPTVRHLNDFLIHQPGFNGLSVRGGFVDETGAWVAGIPFINARIDQPVLGLPLSSIEQVAVESGGWTAEYGHVRSGLIQVQPKTGNRTHYSGQIDVSLNQPHQKHHGPVFFDIDNFYQRVFLNPDIAFVGTQEYYQDDPYLQQQNFSFSGWNQKAKQYNADKSVENQVTPLDLYLWTAWSHAIELPVEKLEQQGFSLIPEMVQAFQDHARKPYGKDPDWNVDVGFGGPVPLIGRFLGYATFYVSHHSNQTHYTVPFYREYQTDEQTLVTVRLNPTPTTRLVLTGYYREKNGVYGADFANSPSTRTFQPINMSTALDPNGWGARWMRAYWPAFFAPMWQYSSAAGLTLSQSLSPKTYLMFKVNAYRVQDEAGGPYTWRSSDPAIEFGPIKLNEVPYNNSRGGKVVDGFQLDKNGRPYGDNYLFARQGNWQDHSLYTGITARLDLSSQVNPLNLVKTGAEFHYLEISEKAWSEIDHPAANRNYVFSGFPIRAGAYIQDQITFQGVVANLGLRLDYINARGEWPTGAQYNPDLYRGGHWDLMKWWEQYDKTHEDENVLEPVDTHTVWSPRLSVAFPVNPFKFYFNYGHYRSEMSNYIQHHIYNGYQFAAQGVISMGNPNLNPPKTISYEVGVDYNVLDQARLRVTGYYKDVSGEHNSVIIRNPAGNVSFRSYKNHAFQSIRGIEISATRDFGEWISGWFNYNYMLFKSGLIDPSDLYGALYPYEQKPQPQVRANIILSTPRDFGPSVFNHAVFGDWRLSVMPIWIRGSYFTWNPLGKQGVRDNLQWPDYALLNARLTKGFRVGRVQIEAYVDAFNVLDQKINNFVAGQAFRNNTDLQNYLASLNLPMYESPDFDGLRENNPGLYLAGDDQIGDLRSEEKPYINDPDIEMWMYGPPRDIWFGLRILF